MAGSLEELTDRLATLQSGHQRKMNLNAINLKCRYPGRHPEAMLNTKGTALHLAVKSDQLTATKLLLDEGAGNIITIIY